MIEEAYDIMSEIISRHPWRAVLFATVIAFFPQAAIATPRSETAALWKAAVDANAPEQIARLYTADAWLKLPCTPVRTGSTAIPEAWRDLYSYSPASISIETESFDLSRGRDVALERGRAQFLQNIGGLPYGTNVEYVRVWHRTGQGWRIAVDIFSPGGSCDQERQQDRSSEANEQP